MSDPSVESTPRDAGTTRADESGQEGTPAAGALPDPDLESPGAAGRAEPGVPPPPDTNQPAVEPIPPHGDRQEAVPANTGGDRGAGTLSSTTSPDVLPSGGAQAPPGSGSPQRLPGTTPVDDRPGVDGDASTSSRQDHETPVSTGVGRSSRTPGDLGTPPQPFDADLEAGAARTAPGRPPQSTPPASDTPGDLHGVSENDTRAMLGTSEQSGVVHGVRTPVSPDGTSAPGASAGRGAPGRTAAAEGAGQVASGPAPGSTSGAASTSAQLPASGAAPDPAAQPTAVTVTDEQGASDDPAPLTSPEAPHVTKDSGPSSGRGAITGRRSSPDGEVGAV